MAMLEFFTAAARAWSVTSNFFAITVAHVALQPPRVMQLHLHGLEKGDVVDVVDLSETLRQRCAIADDV